MAWSSGILARYLPQALITSFGSGKPTSCQASKAVSLAPDRSQPTHSTSNSGVYAGSIRTRFGFTRARPRIGITTESGLTAEIGLQTERRSEGRPPPTPPRLREGFLAFTGGPI